MSGDRTRSGRPRVRAYVWVAADGTEIPGAMVEVRRSGRRISQFIPHDDLRRVADALVDVAEQHTNGTAAGTSGREDRP